VALVAYFKYKKHFIFIPMWLHKWIEWLSNHTRFIKVNTIYNGFWIPNWDYWTLKIR